MLELKDNNGKLLSKKVQKRVNDFIDHLKEISRFKPSKDLQKSEVEKQVKFTLKCFGIEAEIEYRKLSTHKDWDSACYSALDSAWDSALASARASAWASAEILLKDNKQFKEKYPKGAFIQLMKIFEMWLYPVGILEENKKFVIYVPSIPSRVPKDFN